MTNWNEKIMVGDITEAARRAGVHMSNYFTSKNKPAEKWTTGQRKINLALKQIVEEREAEIALLTGKDQAKC